jgi:predicted hotdog family 3-hydroxylacyl-ACP dehydratase
LTERTPAAIEDLIPHRPPMGLLAAIVRVDENGARAVTTVNEHWPAFASGSVPAAIAIELIAQTSALVVGWRKRGEERSGGKGYLVGIKRARLEPRPLEPGMTLVTSVAITREFENYCVFRGTVAHCGQRLAEAVIQAYRPERFDFSAERQ